MSTGLAEAFTAEIVRRPTRRAKWAVGPPLPPLEDTFLEPEVMP
jgi:hypothetical protein